MINFEQTEGVLHLRNFCVAPKRLEAICCTAFPQKKPVVPDRPGLPGSRPAGPRGDTPKRWSSMLLRTPPWRLPGALEKRGLIIHFVHSRPWATKHLRRPHRFGQKIPKNAGSSVFTKYIRNIRYTSNWSNCSRARF